MQPGFLDLLVGDTVTRLVFFPTVAALGLLLFTRASQATIKIYALVASLVELALMGQFLLAHGQASAMLVRDPVLSWIELPALRIVYEVGMDGIALPLVLLTGLLLPVVLLGSWKGIDKHWPGFVLSVLLLTTGIVGSLVALDLFLFYVFWEVMLIPMYLIIGIWGGERRIYAAIKFFLFTMAGSLLMLVAILWIAWTHAQVAGVCHEERARSSGKSSGER